MKSEESLKQLKMALTNHELLIIHWYDRDFILSWDDEIKNYRGYSEKMNLDFGIWTMEYLLNVATGKEKGVSLKIYG